jgi:hypothetical protein
LYVEMDGRRRRVGLTGLVKIGRRVWDLVLGTEVLVEEHVREGGLEELDKSGDDSFPLDEVGY